MTKGQRKMTDYKLVPMEPTQEMIDAARGHHEGEAYLPVSLYKSMLAAAPAVQGEPVAWLRFRSHRVAADDVVEGLEICEPGEIGDDGGPAFPAYTAPQPAKQKPDVAQLVEIAKDIVELHDKRRVVLTVHVEALREALAAPQPAECGCCGQTGRCDDDCDAVVIGGHGAAEKQSVLNLSEAARSLGIAQEKGDQGAIDHWGAMVSRFEKEVIQPTEQQPAPDVAQLVEALEAIVSHHDEYFRDSSVESKMPWIVPARAALAAYRKQGGEV